MTTIAVDLRAMRVAADTQNTDSTGTAFRCQKIDRLDDGSIFVGAGHLLSIGKAKRWANKNFAEEHRPSWDELMGERSDEFKFSCLIIRRDRTVVLIDDEMEPQAITDDRIAIGSGGPYAMGALEAGASVEDAVRIACKRDIYTSEPIDVLDIGPDLSIVRMRA